jgi:hypothetical protein
MLDPCGYIVPGLLSVRELHTLYAVGGLVKRLICVASAASCTLMCKVVHTASRMVEEQDQKIYSKFPG